MIGRGGRGDRKFLSILLYKPQSIDYQLLRIYRQYFPEEEEETEEGKEREREIENIHKIQYIYIYIYLINYQRRHGELVTNIYIYNIYIYTYIYREY